MSKKAINVGIIGVGIVGERFVKALQRHDRANILGIYDTNNERLEYISKEYNLSSVAKYQELLENNDIEVIYLAVPPKYHYPIAMDIISARKHFICEKPLANSINEAREMYEKAEENNIVHAMNFPLIYSPAYKQIKSLLDDRFIGELRRVELNTYFQDWPRFWQQTDWIDTREQGGFVREIFTHYVQLSQRLLGRITDVDTSIQYPDDPSACETGIIARTFLPNNTPMLLNGFSDIGMEEKIALTIYGSEGVISLENWRELWTSKKGEKLTKVDLPENDHLVELIDDVFKAIEGEAVESTTFEEGYYAQVIIEKLLGRDS